MAKKLKSQPEVICLSDDDDDGDKNEKVSAPVTTAAKPTSTTPVNGTRKVESASRASDSTVHRKDIVRIPDLPTKQSELTKKPYELHCSAVRFGLVEFNVEAENFLMKDVEFELKLKSSFMENLNIKLAYTDVVSFYFSFESQPPAAFIQVRADFAALFAKFIPSMDKHGKQFDPDSTDERRRRIVFCLQHLEGEAEKVGIASIYYYLKAKCPTMNICCVSGSKAQELYNLSRFAKVSALGSITTPFVVEANDLTTKTVGLNDNTIRFDLSRDDLLCLNEGEFLNDNIIDFYLQYIYYEKLTPEDRERTYLFNSFFYTRLTRKSNDDVSNIAPAERRYSRVKRWLRDVDIFSKDYLIVPINQTAHWYIVLIQFHNNVPTEGDLISDDDDDDDSRDNRFNSKKKIIKRVNEVTTSNGTVEQGTPKSGLQPIEILDEADEVTAESNHRSDANVQPKNRSHTPAIILFDSLHAGPKNRVAATLREFLQLEYDHKKPLPVGSSARKIFNLDTIPTIEAAVPQQPNYFDCGLFMLQYIESFFAHRSPTINLQSPATFANWCEQQSMGTSKRKQIFDVINQHVIPKGDLS